MMLAIILDSMLNYRKIESPSKEYSYYTALTTTTSTTAAYVPLSASTQSAPVKSK
jgi:hypothetical protein